MQAQPTLMWAPRVSLGFVAPLEGLGGSGIFGVGFVPTNGNGAAFGAHQIVPPGCEQQQVFDGEGDLQLLKFTLNGSFLHHLLFLGMKLE